MNPWKSKKGKFRKSMHFSFCYKPDKNFLSRKNEKDWKKAQVWLDKIFNLREKLKDE